MNSDGRRVISRQSSREEGRRKRRRGGGLVDFKLSRRFPAAANFGFQPSFQLTFVSAVSLFHRFHRLPWHSAPSARNRVWERAGIMFGGCAEICRRFLRARPFFTRPSCHPRAHPLRRRRHHQSTYFNIYGTVTGQRRRRRRWQQHWDWEGGDIAGRKEGGREGRKAPNAERITICHLF